MRATIVIATIGAAAALWRAGAGVSAPSSAPAAARVPTQAPELALPATAPSGASASAAVASALPQTSSAPDAGGLARIEASVREARQQAKGEQEVHRLRSAGMPASQVEALARMEAAETSWRQRVEALQAACAANIGCDDARASFTREELARTTAYAAPTLRQ